MLAAEKFMYCYYGAKDSQGVEIQKARSEYDYKSVWEMVAFETS